MILSAPDGLTIADDTGIVTITNDDPAPLPSLTIADASIVEGNSGSRAVTLTVTLSAPSTGTVTVQYATFNLTATAGSDYRATTGTLTFAAGVTTRTFTVTILGDRTKEPSETFRVLLSGASGATIADSEAIVTIVTDEAALTASRAAPAGGAVHSLTQAELQSAAAAAEAEWLRLRPGADFSGVTYAIADLPELMLGFTSGSVITVDVTAAGWGWDAMDLHAVLMHELGHVLGLDHDEHGLMGETLRPMISSRCGGKTIRSDRRWTARASSARPRQLLSSSRC